MQPITINEGFTCEHCEAVVKKAPSSCRNHCNECLWSKHVDEKVPGDRKSLCLGLMEPIAIISNNKKGQQIMHECTKCGEKKMNKVLPDDNQDQIIKLMQRQNLEPLNE
mgnify:FL=1